MKFFYYLSVSGDRVEFECESDIFSQDLRYKKEENTPFRIVIVD
jgi:hypothetical protein